MNFSETEKIDSTKEEKKSELPFSSEIAEPLQSPEVIVEKNNENSYSVKVDGETLEGYENVLGYELGKTLDPDIQDIFIKEEKDGKGRILNVHKYINTKNPEGQYPTIAYGEHSDNRVFVNGIQWNTLDHQNIYFGGYQVAFDIENKKVVFGTKNSNKKNMVVVNNKPWENSYSYISSLKAKAGHVAALNSSDNERALYIDDRKWQIPENIPDSNNESVNQRKNQEVRMFDINQNTAAVVTSYHDNTSYKEGIYQGDMYGKNSEWKNTFNKVDSIVLDKEQDMVAVLASQGSSHEKVIAINDIICKTKDSIHELQSFEINDGIVFVQYKTPLGEVVAEKIKLLESAEEIQAKNLEKKQANEYLNELYFSLSKQGLTPKEALLKIKEKDEVDEKLRQANDKIAEVSEKLREVKETKDREINEYQNKLEDLQKKDKEQSQVIDKQENNLSTIKNIATKLTKNKFGGGYTISADEYENLKRIINI